MGCEWTRKKSRNSTILAPNIFSQNIVVAAGFWCGYTGGGDGVDVVVVVIKTGAKDWRVHKIRRESEKKPIAFSCGECSLPMCRRHTLCTLGGRTEKFEGIFCVVYEILMCIKVDDCMCVSVSVCAVCWGRSGRKIQRDGLGLRL